MRTPPFTLVALAGAVIANAQTLELDRDNPLSGQTKTVSNASKVEIKLINKDPFDTCTSEIKREAVVEASPIAAILTLVSGAAGSLTLVRTLTPPAPPIGPSAAPGNAPPALLNSLADSITKNLEKLDTEMKDQNKRAIAAKDSFKAASDASQEFLNGKYRRANATDFETKRGAAVKLNEAALDTTLPNPAGLKDFYDLTVKLITQYQQTPGADPNFSAGQIVQVRANLDALTAAVDKLKESAVKLRDLNDYFGRLATPRWEYSKMLNSDQDAKITGSVSCANTLTKNPTLDPVYFTVIFQGPARLSLAPGVLFSALREEKVSSGSVVASRTGAAVTPAAEIQHVTARPQVIPMSLVHIRLGPATLRNNRFFSWNLSPGIGVNPKNKEAEFFLGLSYGIGNFYLSGGGHFGHQERPGGNFQIGDRPTAAVAAVPVTRPWSSGFSFGLTYRIPLK